MTDKTKDKTELRKWEIYMPVALDDLAVEPGVSAEPLVQQRLGLQPELDSSEKNKCFIS